VDDVTGLLTALQFGDGLFPGGGFAFSWGLESLIADGQLTRAGFAPFVDGQLRHRWASFDRVVTAHAHAAACDLARLLDLDDLADAFMTVEAIRVGSRRAGGALLATHLRLGTNGAAALSDAVKRGEGYGHLAVAQGALLAGAGLDRAATLAVSAYAMAQAFGTAAIRLGLIGHLDAQRALSGLRVCIAALVAEDVPATEEIHGFTPIADIAAMRHVDRTLRLFSN
jgi:urease accessory protein